MLVLQNTPRAAFELPADEQHRLELQEVELDSGTARFDLTFALEERKEGLKGELEYNTDLFEEPGIIRLITHFQYLLEQIVARPEQELWQLSPLSQTEKMHILEILNQTEQTLPEEIGLSQMFEIQAQRSPKATALVFEQKQLSYRELNQRANQLAHLLKESGVGPERCVGLAVEPSFEMIIGFLGILKAGGVYVPLDPGYPKERLRFMFADAQIALLLTQQHLMHQLPKADLPTLCLDSVEERIAGYSSENLERETTQENLAYIIYTSGSTGQPKGTMVTHRGLYNLALAQSRAFQINAKSRVLQFASINFDASISEFAMAFISGATLYLAPRDVLAEPLDLLRQQAITKVTLPPAMLAVLPENDLPALKTIVSAGEACTTELVARWAPGRHFFNAYGPTEITVCSTIAECYPDGKQPGIGRPIANNQVYVLDRFMQPVPVGTVGELYLGGIGIARGYLGQPTLSAERFVPDPFSKEAGARLYRTGDLGRYTADGSLYCLGRSDQQIKLHGFRIELGEIEAQLNLHPGVLQAIVSIREDHPGIKRLVAYVVSEKQEKLTGDDLKHYLQERVPHYMIPALIIQLDALPYLPNGKVDRKALPAPDSERSEQEYTAASTEIEHILADICESVLGIEHIGVNDNFFELGGDSILSIQVIVKAREAGLQLSP
ncbi:MAG TPA: amino acid adenylation domain-containing protein, partial [Ktedonobacteraceae bacterium]